MQRNPVGKLLLFGATGDLAKRMLLPSLYGLHADGLLPKDLTITGSARGDMSPGRSSPGSSRGPRPKRSASPMKAAAALLGNVAGGARRARAHG